MGVNLYEFVDVGERGVFDARVVVCEHRYGGWGGGAAAATAIVIYFFDGHHTAVSAGRTKARVRSPTAALLYELPDRSGSGESGIAAAS